MMHGLVVESSIFVTDAGEFRLGGFSFTQAYSDDLDSYRVIGCF